MSTPTPAPGRLRDALRYIGPGLIVTASIVGSGELIVTPRVAAENGYSLLWLIVLGCMVKVFVQIELGRYSVAKGVTTLQALNQIPGPRFRVSWILWIWAVVFLAIISQVGGIIGGTAEVLAAGGVPVSNTWLAVLIGGSCAALLAMGRYKLVEVFSTILVVIFTVATVVAVGALQWSEYRISTANIVDGFRFHLPQNFGTAFAALGIIGVGASELIYYPYWCLEKGYAARVGPRDAAGWLERARGWMRVMRVDAWLSMIIYTSATAAFYLLGAAVLHAKSLKVSDKDMIPTLAHMYQESFGAWGLWIFLIGAFAVLYSTAFAATASNARLLADALELFGLKRYASEEARARMVKICCVVLPTYATAIYLVTAKPVTLVMISGVGQALLLPFLAGAALYFRYRKLDPELRPGPVWSALLWLSALCMGAAGAYQIYDQLLK
ncbi:MAG: Nramp family divalent metal transporter [Verrucomicrobia bacterium]|nr:Nramp family divalent metal transporter [Verrucomicrobiota bacterium]